METDEITQNLKRMADWQQSHEIEDRERHEDNLLRFKAADARASQMTDTLKGIQAALEAHTEMLGELKPLLQAAAGGRIAYKIFTVVGTIAVSWLAIKSILHL